MAEEAVVEKALLGVISAQMRRRPPAAQGDPGSGKQQQLQRAGQAGGIGGAARMAARAAAASIQSAREHLLQRAEELTELARQIAEAEAPPDSQPLQAGEASAPERQGLSPEEEAELNRAGEAPQAGGAEGAAMAKAGNVSETAALAWRRGQARCCSG